MLKIQGQTLFADQLQLAFPAVRIAIGGKVIEPTGEGKKCGTSGREYQLEGLTIKVEVRKLNNGVFSKRVSVKSDRQYPTPDWVELDRQQVPDPQLQLRGYFATTENKGRPQAEEAGGTLMPGCGYPLIGKNFFAGVEHPGAFARLETADAGKSVYFLRQHPVWSDDNTLELADAVFAWSSDADKSFRNYLDSIRIAPRKTPLVSLCSFWSDPYLGNYEYLISPDNYQSFVDAFYQLGLRPDVYTLDAGWQDRQSIFEPKPSFGGQAGLDRLEKHIRKRGSHLGLWISHNGPMGIAPEYMKRSGLPVGAGESSTYCGEGYGVLMDKEFEKLLGDRLVELARSGAMHFKMDWDNDCATNESFDEKYPTRDHVREGSINAIIRIAQRIRKANPELAMRYGWWPSPWWLKYNHHFFLPDSGDSEYTSLPSRTQRDSAITYRDTMYYCCFNRDRSAFPLDAVDNHEFPHALRNPFHEDPGVIANTAMVAIMRGCSYLPLKLQPEALEPWFVKALSASIDFARNYGSKFYQSRSSMFGGNPNAGDIYGFRYEQADGSCWCMLRNPSAMPQEYDWQDEKRSGVWIYPYYARYTAGEKIMFAPHEVKVVILSPRKLALPYEVPFQAAAVDGKVEFRFPAHLTVSKHVQPMVGDIYRIGKSEVEWKVLKEIEDGLEVIFRLRLPYRMRNSTINAALQADDPAKAQLTARFSRYAVDFASCFELPVTRFSSGIPGAGQMKNPDVVPEYKEALFAIPASEGGEGYYSLFFKGIKSLDQVKLSVSGFYAQSREAITRDWTPAWLNNGLAPQNPDGFPTAELLELPAPEEFPAQ